MGVSADLAVHYVRAGWLTRLARGVFARPDTPLELHAEPAAARASPEGRCTSEANQHSTGTAFGTTSPSSQNCSSTAGHQVPLPSWFTERFPSSYHRLRLFDEQPDALLRVSRFQRKADGPLVSDPERAVLELLSDVGVRQPLQEARDLLEGTPSLRAAVLQELLARCKQVKTVRLCLTLGRELGLPWAAKLDPKRLPTGSDQRWVGRSKEGLLVLKA